MRVCETAQRETAQHETRQTIQLLLRRRLDRLDILSIVIPLPLGLRLDGFHKIASSDKAMAYPRSEAKVSANG
jgi:hypothetical protein